MAYTNLAAFFAAESRDEHEEETYMDGSGLGNQLLPAISATHPGKRYG